jgi:hypothetical protein
MMQRLRADCRQAGAMLAVTAAIALGFGVAFAADSQSVLSTAAQGTQFSFEVVESRDALYLGDTPSHLGRDGGLTVRPNVALGDAVYKTVGTERTRVGRISRVAWNRVSGSLEVEFSPEPLLRIAVGDEVWIDLNPKPADPEHAGR